MSQHKKLSNNYDVALKEQSAKKAISQQNVVKKAKEAKGALDDLHAKINLGDSPQVNEAVMISFLLAIAKNIGDGFSLYKKYITDLSEKDKDKKLSPLDKKLATLKDLENAQERMSKYTALMLRREALEKRAEELKDNSTKANPEYTTKEQEKKSIASKLKETYDGLNEIYDAYGFTQNPEGFMQALDKSREKWFGVGASFLSDAELGKTDDLINMAEKAGVSLLSGKVEDVMGFINGITKTLASEEGKTTIENLVKEGTELSTANAQPTLS